MPVRDYIPGTMIDTLKKTLLAGVGAAVITKDKVEAALEDFVAKGKVSAADARKMAEKIAREGREEFDQVSDQLGTKIKDVLARMDSKTQERLAALEARVEVLEKKAARSRSSKS